MSLYNQLNKNQNLSSDGFVSKIETICKNNPNYNKVINLIQSSNMNPRDFFYSQARNMGVDPNQIINNIRNLM